MKLFYKKRISKYIKSLYANIEKKGKIVTYMESIYEATEKKYKNINIEKMYIKCYKYARKKRKMEVETAKAYLNSEIKLFEILSIMIGVACGFATVELELQGLGAVIGLFIIIFTIIMLKKSGKIIKRENFLLHILENVSEDESI